MVPVDGCCSDEKLLIRLVDPSVLFVFIVEIEVVWYEFAALEPDVDVAA